MVDVLVIPDGAAQPLRPGHATALEASHTPVLDRLATTGAVRRVATTPAGLPPGSETGIPALLGQPQPTAVGRGWIDACAYGVAVPAGMTPWRADVLDRHGRRASEREARLVCAQLDVDAVAVGGHRLVLIAASAPRARRLLGLHVRVWPGGPSLEGSLTETTLICGPGAAAGCGRSLGADVVIPAGATGDVDTDLDAKARAASSAIEAGGPRVVVHVGGPDEAAHRADQEAVIAALERLDARLLAPLSDAVAADGGRLAVCPDHGTDPITGEHDAAPVPALAWGAGVEPDGAMRFSERAALTAAVLEASWLWASFARVA